MSEPVRTLLGGLDHLVLVYFFVLNSAYLLLVVVAGTEVARTVRRVGIAGYDEIFASPFTPAMTVLVPACNEAGTIVETVRGLLDLHFPEHEVLVVDDGSTDATFANLEREFGLVEVERVIPGLVPVVGQVRSVHVARNGDALVVLRKDGTGRKADALNAGINAARHPIVCMVDADSVLDDNALLRVAKPFVDDPERVVGVGGAVRPVNGSEVAGGHVVEACMPRNWLARVQAGEYLRSFLLGRAAWSRLDSMLITSGAFSAFRRDVLSELGGLADCVTEDAELVTRIHRHMRATGRAYRLVFVAEPICWTEVPERMRVLGWQRRRWSRGLAEVLWRHRTMIGNPRYGRIGLVVLPYFVAFEVLGAFVELFGLAAVAAGVAVGAVDLRFAALFGLVAGAYGLLVSIAALTIEEGSFHRYTGRRDLVIGVAAAAGEHVAFRPVHAWWRVRGVVAAVRNEAQTWGAMPRNGFEARDDRATRERRRVVVGDRRDDAAVAADLPGGAR